MKDVFICYVARDKEFAHLLAESLSARNISIVDSMLALGDSLRNRVEQGLREAQYGIVILSAAFFRKPWPRYDLDQLATMDQEFDGRSMLLPIWLGVSQQDIGRYSSMLASKIGMPVALDAVEETLGDVVAEIVAVVQPAIEKSITMQQYSEYERQTKSLSTGENVSSDLTSLRNAIVKHFSSAELVDLCWDLSIDYDDLPGSTRSAKARELIGFMNRRGRLEQLVVVLQRRRPLVNW